MPREAKGIGCLDAWRAAPPSCKETGRQAFRIRCVWGMEPWEGDWQGAGGVAEKRAESVSVCTCMKKVACELGGSATC